MAGLPTPEIYLKRLPFKLLIGPLSPLIQQAGRLVTLSLTHPQCLGAYLNHPDILPFYMHPQTLTLEPGASPELPAGTLLYGGPDGYSLNALLARADWQPDLVIWWGFHYALPADLASCPYPTALIVSDWHFHLEAVYAYASEVDYLLCDRSLLQPLQQMGHQASYWPAYGFNPEHFDLPEPADREIDICFLGNTNPAYYPERNRWLRRLSKLADKHKILLRHGVAHPAYEQTLSRSKLVFNHGLRREMNLRAYEAAASGALLLMEADNLEIRDFLDSSGPEQACVLYDSENFEEQILYYLHHDSERHLLARRARQQIQAYSYQRQFGLLLQQIPEILQQIQKKQLRQPFKTSKAALLSEVQQQLTTNLPSLRARVLQQLEGFSEAELLADPELLNALAVCRVDYQSLLLEGLEVYLPKRSLPELAQLLQTSLQLRPLAHSANNLCWLAFLNGDWALLGQSLPAFHQLLAQTTQLAPQTMLLPVRFTPLYVLRQKLFYEHSQHPAELQKGLMRLLRWSALYLQGNFCLTQQQPAQAASAFVGACTQASELAESWLELARCCQALGQTDAAIQALEAGLEQGVYYPAAWLMLIELALEQKQYQKAQSLLKQASVLFQDSRRFEGFVEALSKLQQRLQEAA